MHFEIPTQKDDNQMGNHHRQDGAEEWQGQTACDMDTKVNLVQTRTQLLA